MNALSLAELVEKLLPESVSLLKHHHTAGVDALLHRRLGYALYGLSRAPCRMVGKHEKVDAPEGSGAATECTRCGERF